MLVEPGFHHSEFQQPDFEAVHGNAERIHLLLAGRWRNSFLPKSGFRVGFAYSLPIHAHDLPAPPWILQGFPHNAQTDRVSC